MTRASPLVREATLSAGAAGALAAVLVWLGPPGADLAAHAYQRALFLDHGFALWNNFWYAGRYSFVTYSVLYYPLAALLGIRLLAVATSRPRRSHSRSCSGASGGRAARWSSRTFAVVWAGIVLSAAFPFAPRRGARAARALGAPGAEPLALRAPRRADTGCEPARVPAAHAPARRLRDRALARAPRAPRAGR